MPYARVIGAGLFIAAAAFGGFFLSENTLNAAVDSEGGQGRPNSPTRVQVSAITTERFVDSVLAVGTTQARRAVELMPATSGQIVEILFETGQRVEAGQILLRLRDVAERAAVKAAEATLAEAQNAFDRQTQLTETRSTTQVQLETARAALMRAEADLELARAALDDRVLRAPFDGVTGLSDLSVGAYIDAATVVTTLDDLETITVAFQVPERVLADLSEGQEVAFISAAYPDQTFLGTLNAIDSRVDQTTRSVALRAEVPNADGRLIGGMFTQVSLVLDARRTTAVPEQALVMSGGETYVYLAEDGQVRQVPVTTGTLKDGRIEIATGLEDTASTDAQVIVSNLQRLSDGDSIEVSGAGNIAAAELETAR